MNWGAVVIALIAGIAIGLAAAFFLRLMRERTTRQVAEELFRESETQRKAAMDAVIENLKESFGSLSLNALSRSTEEFLKLAKTTLGTERETSAKELDTKKGLIDQQLEHMTTKLDGVSKLMNELEKDRVEKYGELATHLKVATAQTSALAQTTNTLREALASTRVRGQWGERMAEDVLRLAGFVEDVNYHKQKTIEGVGTRPDFTFLLPRNLQMNMDVKFPLDNYVRFVEADSEMEKDKYCSDFLRDVKVKLKEVTTRDYINPDQNTVDYVLLFIPNEQIYAFIHERDSSILDDGIRNKVVFCSPVTLFAVLAVIRQAVENFALEQTSNEMLGLFGAFRKQWDEFVKKFDQMGKRIEDAQREYDALAGIRRRKLEKPLDRIESLRMARGLEIALVEDQGSSVLIEEGGDEGESTEDSG